MILQRAFPECTHGTAQLWSGFSFTYIELRFHGQDTFESTEQGRNVLASGSKTDLNPLHLVDWDEMTSDFAIKRFAFAGVAAHTTEKTRTPGDMVHGEPIVYKSDFSFLEPLNVRSGFERYGAIAYFGGNGTLLKLYWSHGRRNITRPGTAGEAASCAAEGQCGDDEAGSQREWAHAKWAYKSVTDERGALHTAACGLESHCHVFALLQIF